MVALHWYMPIFIYLCVCIYADTITQMQHDFSLDWKAKNSCSMKLSFGCVAFNCEPVRKQKNSILCQQDSIEQHFWECQSSVVSRNIKHQIRSVMELNFRFCPNYLVSHGYTGLSHSMWRAFKSYIVRLTPLESPPSPPCPLAKWRSGLLAEECNISNLPRRCRW